MNRGNITQFFRHLGLIHWFDRMKFVWQKSKNASHNAEFMAQHPDVKLPPDYMLFEAFQLDYEKYYEGGQRTAKWLLDSFQPHIDLNGKTILDWGCGPARVVRHLPELLSGGTHIHGTDYNPETVAWCREYITGVTFSMNGLNPPTAYPDAQFDAIYGISIFTHLSESNHYQWFHELMRMTRPGGVVLLTLHGEAFLPKLTEPEQAQFKSGKLVVRGRAVEGHRVFAAFHPDPFVHSLFAPLADVLVHIKGQTREWGPEQDVWVVRKRAT